MAVIPAMPSEAIISGFKGTIDYYLHWGIACVRKWPRSPGHFRAPAVEAGWLAFTEASRLWIILSPEIQRAFEEMASGSGLSGRDMFERCYLSGYKKTIATVDELE